jgi:hypothetical protein
MVTLPLWIVTEHIQPANPEHTRASEPGTALAFSSAERLFRFMKSRLAGEWKMEMAADRDGLMILIADLHRLDITALTLNPEQDATGGEPVALADLMAFARTLNGDGR